MGGTIVYNLNKLEENVSWYVDLFGKNNVYYSVMTNSNPVIINKISELGLGFFVNSYSHFKLLQKHENIMFTASGFPELDKIEEILSSSYVNISSMRQYQILKKLFPDKKFGVRVNASNFDVSETSRTAVMRLGFTLEEIKEIARVDPCLDSLHYYQGGFKDNESYIHNLNKLVSISKSLNIDNVNLSGGLPVNVGEGLRLFLLEMLKVGDINYSVEPGRSIVNNAATFEVQVLDVIWRDGKQYVIASATFEAFPRYMIQRENIDFLDSSLLEGNVETYICGPSCYSKDILYHGKLKRLEVGDLIQFNNVGAYFEQYASDYLGFGFSNLKFKE